MTYESWLSRTFTDYNSLDDWHTNQQILNMPPEDRPDDWFNPWTLTQEEIDQMRRDFNGGYKKWVEFVKENLPNLDPEVEGKLRRKVNRERDIRLCGTISKIKINPLTKKLKREYWYCKRRGCPKCEAMRKDDLQMRMAKMVGMSYVILDSNKAVEDTLKNNEVSNYFRKVMDDGHILLIADKPIGETFTASMAKEFATIPPQGTNVSGKLGKGEDNSFDSGEREIAVDCREYLVDTSPEQLKELETEYQKEVEDIQAETLDDVQSLVYRCEDVLESIAARKQIKIFFLYKTKVTVREKDFIKYASIRQAVPS